jgi:hypothetical protein
LGFTGPRQEAEDIKARLAQFLRDDLKLELNQDKTLITHERSGAARFLGYEITVQHADHKTTHGHRSVNGKVALRVPRDVITAKSAPFMKLGKPELRPELLNHPDHEIIGRYGAQWRGYLRYYLLGDPVPVYDEGRPRCRSDLRCLTSDPQCLTCPLAGYLLTGVDSTFDADRIARPHAGGQHHQREA